MTDGPIIDYGGPNARRDEPQPLATRMPAARMRGDRQPFPVSAPSEYWRDMTWARGWQPPSGLGDRIDIKPLYDLGAAIRNETLLQMTVYQTLTHTAEQVAAAAADPTIVLVDERILASVMLLAPNEILVRRDRTGIAHRHLDALARMCSIAIEQRPIPPTEE